MEEERKSVFFLLKISSFRLYKELKNYFSREKNWSSPFLLFVRLRFTHPFLSPFLRLISKCEYFNERQTFKRNEILNKIIKEKKMRDRNKNYKD